MVNVGQLTERCINPLVSNWASINIVASNKLSWHFKRSYQGISSLYCRVFNDVRTWPYFYFARVDVLGIYLTPNRTVFLCL